MFYVPSIVLGELYTGIQRVTNKAKHLKKLNNFLRLCIVPDVDIITAQHYGVITAGLYKKGKPLPLNDVWIAAVALQKNLTVVSRDKHFNEIDGLKIKVW